MVQGITRVIDGGDGLDHEGARAVKKGKSPKRRHWTPEDDFQAPAAAQAVTYGSPEFGEAIGRAGMAILPDGTAHILPEGVSPFDDPATAQAVRAYEKEHFLTFKDSLKKDGWTLTGRDRTDAQGRRPQYDNVILFSLPAGEWETLTADQRGDLVRLAVDEVRRSQLADVLGEDGRKLVVIDPLHDHNGNLHLTALVNRFSVDPGKKEVSPAQKFFEIGDQYKSNLNKRLADAGIPVTLQTPREAGARQGVSADNAQEAERLVAEAQRAAQPVEVPARSEADEPGPDRDGEDEAPGIEGGDQPAARAPAAARPAEPVPGSAEAVLHQELLAATARQSALARALADVRTVGSLRQQVAELQQGQAVLTRQLRAAEAAVAAIPEQMEAARATWEAEVAGPLREQLTATDEARKAAEAEVAEMPGRIEQAVELAVAAAKDAWEEGVAQPLRASIEAISAELHEARATIAEIPARLAEVRDQVLAEAEKAQAAAIEQAKAAWEAAVAQPVREALAAAEAKAADWMGRAQDALGKLVGLTDRLDEQQQRHAVELAAREAALTAEREERRREREEFQARLAALEARLATPAAPAAAQAAAPAPRAPQPGRDFATVAPDAWTPEQRAYAQRALDHYIKEGRLDENTSLQDFGDRAHADWQEKNPPAAPGDGTSGGRRGPR